MGEQPSDEDRVRALLQHEMKMSAPNEMQLSEAIADLIIGNPASAHDLLLLIESYIDRSFTVYTWRFMPAVLIGLLSAAIWCEKNSKTYNCEFAAALPVTLGTLLRRYIDRAPNQPDKTHDLCGEGAIGRFSDLLTLYTSTGNPDENTRRIAFMLGRAAKYGSHVPDCTAPIVSVVAQRALTFLCAGAQIRAVNAQLNAERIIP